MSTDRVIDELQRLPATQRPVLIAIDGFGGSGKSTFAAKLRTALAGEESRSDTNWLIWESNSLSEHIVVPEVDYLIVEGTSSYHPDLVGLYALRIWIETPIDVARERGRARNAGDEHSQHWNRWAENDRRYQQLFHPELAAESVVSGV